MVTHSRAATGAHALRPLNRPQPVAVDANAWGEPLRVTWRGSTREVETLEDRWRIDDEWWRAPIARRYFRVAFATGQRLTVFHDLVADTWHAQAYNGPWRGTRNEG